MTLEWLYVPWLAVKLNLPHCWMEHKQEHGSRETSSIPCLNKQTKTSYCKKRCHCSCSTTSFPGFSFKGASRREAYEARLCSKKNVCEIPDARIWFLRKTWIFFLPSWKEGLGSRDHKTLLEYSLAARILLLSHPNWLTLFSTDGLSKKATQLCSLCDNVLPA